MTDQHLPEEPWPTDEEWQQMLLDLRNYFGKD